MSPGAISLLACSNEYYAPGLAVTLHSLLAHATASRPIQITVVDGGMRESTWAKLESTVASIHADATIHRTRPLLAPFADLVADYGGSHLTYARLLVDEVCADSERVLYVDSDILIRRDASELFERDLDSHTVAACRDVPIGTLGGEHIDCEALGLDPNAPYFNSGVLLIDMDRWRKERVRERTLAHLRAHGASCTYWDQSALNVTLCGDWATMEPEWNLFHLLMDSPPTALDVAAANIHYVGPEKPWLWGCDDVPGSKDFRQALARTAFAHHEARRTDRVMSRTVAWFESVEDSGESLRFVATPRWKSIDEARTRADMHAVCRFLREDQIHVGEIRVVDDAGEDLVVLTFA